MGQQTDYKAELDKLPPEERERYTNTWRDYLSTLPQPAYSSQLTQLTNMMGPDFASSLVQPTAPVQVPDVKPIARAPAADIKEEQAWWQKPIAWAAEQEAIAPLFKGLEKYYGEYITPAAMSAGQLISPKLREGMAGRRPFDIPKDEREELWSDTGLPWLAKTATELAVDPLSYFGWGIAPRVLKGLQASKTLKGLAPFVKPIASAEEAYIRAASVPIRGAATALKKLPAIVPDIAALRAGQIAFHKPLKESARSIVNNIPVHTFDTLHNLGLAGEIVGKPFSQILENLRMGIPDNELFKTIIHPAQKRALMYLQKNADKLDLDTVIKIADKHPDTAASVIGWKQVGLVAKELNLPAPKMAEGLTGSFQKMSNKLYSLWRRTVLQTPYYVLQNTVENPIREILVGVRPFFDITDYAKISNFAEHPMDIQRRVISLADRWNRVMPEHLSGPFARTPSTGGVTEAVTGAVAVGKTFPASTVAAYMDDTAIVHTYFQYYDRYVKSIMEKSSPETAEFVAKIGGLYDDVIRLGTATEVPPSVLTKVERLTNAEVKRLGITGKMRGAPKEEIPRVISGDKAVFEREVGEAIPQDVQALLDKLDSIDYGSNKVYFICSKEQRKEVKRRIAS